MVSTLREVRQNSPKQVLLYLDEVTLYRQPTPASIWHERGHLQPQMRLSARHNTPMRVLGLIDACTGKLFFWHHSKITASLLGKHYLDVAAAYPEAENIYIVMDNWPVHFHERALKPLQKDPRVQLLRLPTYAPWLNPIEKVWRWLRQELTHAHPWSNDFDRFKLAVMALLRRHADASPFLLQYIGLSQ